MITKTAHEELGVSFSKEAAAVPLLRGLGSLLGRRTPAIPSTPAYNPNFSFSSSARNLNASNVPIGSTASSRTVNATPSPVGANTTTRSINPSRSGSGAGTPTGTPASAGQNSNFSFTSPTRTLHESPVPIGSTRPFQNRAGQWVGGGPSAAPSAATNAGSQAAVNTGSQAASNTGSQAAATAAANVASQSSNLTRGAAAARNPRTLQRNRSAGNQGPANLPGTMGSTATQGGPGVLDNVGNNVQSVLNMGRDWINNAFRNPATTAAMTADQAANIGRVNRFLPGFGAGVAGTMGFNMLTNRNNPQNQAPPQYYR